MMMKTTPPITPPIMAPVFLLLVDGADVGATNKMIIHQTQKQVTAVITTYTQLLNKKNGSRLMHFLSRLELLASKLE